jgi:hypothetical protein
MQRSKKNNEDHSSERTDKCAQKRFDKVGIVRDVRLPDVIGRYPNYRDKTNDINDQTYFFVDGKVSSTTRRRFPREGRG